MISRFTPRYEHTRIDMRDQRMRQLRFHIQNYVIAKAEEWLWENDDFKANFIIPEPQQSSATQTPRSVSPIQEKGTHLEITLGKSQQRNIGG